MFACTEYHTSNYNKLTISEERRGWPQKWCAGSGIGLSKKSRLDIFASHNWTTAGYYLSLTGCRHLRRAHSSLQEVDITRLINEYAWIRMLNVGPPKWTALTSVNLPASGQMPLHQYEHTSSPGSTLTKNRVRRRFEWRRLNDEIGNHQDRNTFSLPKQKTCRFCCFHTSKMRDLLTGRAVKRSV